MNFPQRATLSAAALSAPERCRRPVVVSSHWESRDGRKLAIAERLPNSPAETRIVELGRRVEEKPRLEGEFGVMSWTADGRALLGYLVVDSSFERACCFAAAQLDLASLTARISETQKPYRFMYDPSV